MIKVTYEYHSANGNIVRHTYRCVTDKQAEHVCRMVETRKERGYRLVDVSRE